MFNELNIFDGSDHLDRLSNLLHYEFSPKGMIGTVLGVFLIISGTFQLAFDAYFLYSVPILIIIAFTVYMMFVLIKEKRYGWIVFFFCLIIIPVLLIIFYTPSPLLLFIPLAFLFFYCFLLKISVDDWIRERDFIMYPDDNTE
jgi:hypothetical protein